MHSLEEQSLHFVARNICFYEVDAIRDLSRPVLEQLALYLSAYQLNRLNEVFSEAGILLSKIWRKHLSFHWFRKSDCSATIFNTDHEFEKQIEPRSRFLERLFQKILGNLDSDSTQYLNVTLMLRCRHNRAFHCKDSTALTQIALHRELLDYAGYVRILTVAANSRLIKYLLRRRSLLIVLRRSVQRIDVYGVNKTNFSGVKEFVRFFMSGDCLSEFAMFRSNLPSVLLKELLLMLSGCTPVYGENFAVDKKEPEGTTACITFEIFDELLSERNECRADDVEDTDLELTRTVSEDLFDVALTSLENSIENISDSNARIVNSSHSSELYLSDLQRLDSIQTVFRTDQDISSLRSQTINDGCLSSLCDLASEPESCSELLPSHGDSSHKVSSFALAYFSGDRQMKQCLVESLGKWEHLKKLAFFDVSTELNAEESEDLVTFDNCIHLLIKTGCLTHITVCGQFPFSNAFDCVFSALLMRPKNMKPMEEISLHNCKDTTIVSPSNLCRGEFHGVTFLDLSDSMISDITFDAVVFWIKRDRALRCLRLPYFYAGVPTVLEAVKCNSKLEELDLSSNLFDLYRSSVLWSTLQTISGLRKLNLTACNLSQETINAESFIKAICQCSSLREINLSQNDLEKIGCELLKEICQLPLNSVRYELIDLSSNRIKGDLLFDALTEIKSVRSHFPIEELNLSANLFEGTRDRLVVNFADCVDIFVADDPNLAYPAGSIADHVAQM